MTPRPAALAGPMALALLLAGCGAPAPGLAPEIAAAPDEPPLEAPAQLVLGRTPAGTRMAGTLALRAKRPVRVESVEASCECTTAAAEGLPRELRAGETLAIAVEMDLGKVGRGGLPKEGETGPGRVKRQVIVKSSRGETRVDVLTEVSDAVLIDPPEPSFGTIAVGQTLSTAVRVRPLGSLQSVAVLSAETSEPGLSVRATPDGTGSLLRLDWSPAEPGKKDAPVTLRLDAPADPVVVFHARAAVVRLATVAPERIENLAAPMTRPVVAALTVRRLDEEPLRIRSATADNHRVQVEVFPPTGATCVVQVVIPVLPPPAESAGTVTIVTDVPGAERLTVPFRVRGAPPG